MKTRWVLLTKETLEQTGFGDTYTADNRPKNHPKGAKKRHHSWGIRRNTASKGGKFWEKPVVVTRIYFGRRPEQGGETGTKKERGSWEVLHGTPRDGRNYTPG